MSADHRQAAIDALHNAKEARGRAKTATAAEQQNRTKLAAQASAQIAIAHSLIALLDKENTTDGR